MTWKSKILYQFKTVESYINFEDLKQKVVFQDISCKKLLVGFDQLCKAN